MFKINLLTFIGIMLSSVIIFGLVLSVIQKVLKRNKEPDSFILPDIMAKKMKVTALKTQSEATILSVFFMILGVIGFVIYYVFFSISPWQMKFFVGFNSICGVVLLLTILTSNYQQYISICESDKLFHELITEQDVKIDMKGGIN